MKSSRQRLVSVLLSIIYPGAGHLYEERYLPGAAAVILTTWSLLALFVSFVIFTPTAGLGQLIFSLSLYMLIGLWAACLASVLLKGIRLRRPSIDLKELYGEGYSRFLKKEYEDSLKLFSRILKSYPDEPAAWIMKARIYKIIGSAKKGRRIFKYLLRKISDPHWQWEVKAELARGEAVK